MAGISTGDGDGLNVDVNVVPFIDLLSCLVSFLLVTAVWTQIGTMPASVESKGGKSAATPPPNAEKRIMVHLSARGYDIRWPASLSRGTAPGQLPKAGNEFDTVRLKEVIAALKKPDGTLGAVTADDTIPYGAVVRAVDAVRGGGVASVALGTY